ncbi:MAG: hypothetical protein MJ094_04615 [Saccharofermentans sp.]|nr:hypothetical protein [Saccharofermentans sp.]
MHNHKITIKEAIVIFVLSLAVIAYLYYAFFWTSYQRKLSSYNTIDIDSQIEVEQMRATSLTNMRNEIENSSNSNLGQIAIYNNQSNEIRELSSIITNNATGILMTWKDPVLDGSIVRRQVELTFIVDSYEEALDIISSISNCEYRLVINNLSIEGEEGVIEVIDYENDDITYVDAPISVSLTITFFETTVGADSEAGLIVTTTTIEEDSIENYDMFD